MGDIENLPHNVGELKHLICDCYQQINHLQDRLTLLQVALYAPKSEKSKDLYQGILPLPIVRIAEPKPAEVPVVEVPAHTRAKRGRKPLTDHLPRIVITHDLPEEQKVCACGACLKRIGEEVSEKLDYVPAVIQVERHIRPKYACPACDGEEGHAGGAHRTHAATDHLQGHRHAESAGAGTAKFVDAMPFYRQTKQFARLGVGIPRHSMSG